MEDPSAELGGAPPSTGSEGKKEALCRVLVLLTALTQLARSGELTQLVKKKGNGQPKGGMGGRHAATTQGF